MEPQWGGLSSDIFNPIPDSDCQTSGWPWSGRAAPALPGCIRYRPVRLWQGRRQPRYQDISLYFQFFGVQAIVVPPVDSRFGDRSKWPWYVGVNAYQTNWDRAQYCGSNRRPGAHTDASTCIALAS